MVGMVEMVEMASIVMTRIAGKIRRENGGGRIRREYKQGGLKRNNKGE